MSWIEKSHNGYRVYSTELKTYSAPRAVWTDEFSIPPGTDFWVIGNYKTVNLSASTHMEMFISDVPGGTFVSRGLGVGGFNSTTAAIDNARVNIYQDVSTTKEYPRYKIKIPGGGGLVKIVIMYGKIPT